MEEKEERDKNGGKDNTGDISDNNKDKGNGNNINNKTSRVIKGKG